MATEAREPSRLEAREPDHLFWLGVFAVAIFGSLSAVQWSRLGDVPDQGQIVTGY